VLRQLLEHPTGFTYGTLVISTGIALLSGFDSWRTFLMFLAQVGAFAVWVQAWGWRRRKDPAARSIGTRALAVLGIVLLASLAFHHLSFAFVATTLLPQYFTLLPLGLACLAFVPMFVAAEYSHAMAILANPTAFPYGMTIIRGVAVLLIGVCFRVVALQMSDRARLQASLAAAERKAGMLEERQRLAREIHDTLAQDFASIIVHLERAEQINGLAASPAKGHLDLARSVAREGLEEARRMLGALRPEILEQRALPEALERLCERWAGHTGIAANLSITGSPAPLHPDIELTILRGVQESLTNVARHSGARTTAVTLSYMEDVIVLDVQDDGKGFDGATGNRNGFGLTGMRERAESLQGSLMVESVPGEGTTISISLPMVRPAGGDTAAEVSA
jgi:signal transduction histidine kinase